MKKVILAAAAIILSLTACNNTPTTPAGGNEAPPQERVVSGSEYSPAVAYIKIDSLLAGYDLAIELQTAFQTRYNKADRDLSAKYSKWEKDMMDAQEKVQKGLVTRAQAAELETKLGEQQQDIVQSRDRVMAELAEEEQVMNNRIFYGVTDYLKEFNADFKYSMIISTSASGPILHADPSMDITGEVLAALNAQYAEEKAGRKK